MKYLWLASLAGVAVIAYWIGLGDGREECPEHQERLRVESEIEAEERRRFDEWANAIPSDREVLCDEFFERAIDIYQEDYLLDQEAQNEAAHDTYER